MKLRNIHWFPDIAPVPNLGLLAQGVAIFAGLAAVFSLIGRCIPVDGFFAFDRAHFFGIGNIPEVYPPWSGLVVRWLNYPVLIGLTLAAVRLGYRGRWLGLAGWRYAGARLRRVIHTVAS